MLFTLPFRRALTLLNCQMYTCGKLAKISNEAAKMGVNSQFKTDYFFLSEDSKLKKERFRVLSRERSPPHYKHPNSYMYRRPQR